MQITQQLEFGKYYHIYNRGINSENLFKENRNHYHFLNLYARHIEPIAETLAWCLLKNHFHLLVPWSSYLTCISDKPTKLKRDKVILLFEGIEDLKILHNQNENFNSLEQFLNI